MTKVRENYKIDLHYIDTVWLARFRLPPLLPVKLINRAKKSGSFEYIYIENWQYEGYWNSQIVGKLVDLLSLTFCCHDTLKQGEKIIQLHVEENLCN